VIWTHNRSLGGQQGFSSPVSLLVGLLAGLFSHLSFADGQGANARFNQPRGVVVAVNGDIFVANDLNHSIRVVTP
jgi:hypothetical protein